MSEIDIELEHVTYTYPGQKIPALNDLSIRIGKGEKILVTGPGGAGKTTFCRTLLGLVPHFDLGNLQGRVLVRGQDTKKTTIAELSRTVGFIQQDPLSQLVCATVEDEVAFGPENLGVEPADTLDITKRCLEYVRLTGYENRMPVTLSGGEQQACVTAAIMAMNPEIYILDEATSSLDPLGSTRTLNIMKDLVEKENKTFIVVEHKMQELVDLVDRMVVMDKGKIVADDKPREVMKKGKMLYGLGLEPPDACMLSLGLEEKGIKIGHDGHTPCTVEEAIASLKGILAGTKQSVDFGEHPLVTHEESPVIEVKSLWHVYPDGDVQALKGVDLAIYPGEFVTIIGQNGSGKSTLVKHFTGLLKPTKGTVEVFDKDTRESRIVDLSTKVGYVFQNPDLQLFSRTVAAEIGFGPKNLGLREDEIERRVHEMADKLSISYALNISPGSLDAGARQRVAIASVLAMRPEILVIDEPMTGQDPLRAHQIMQIMTELNKEGKTIIAITHNMRLAAEYSRRIVIMHAGTFLYDGPTKGAFSNPELLQRTFLKPPDITSIAQGLDSGVPPNVLSVKEMIDVITRLVGEQHVL